MTPYFFSLNLYPKTSKFVQLDLSEEVDLFRTKRPHLTHTNSAHGSARTLVHYRLTKRTPSPWPSLTLARSTSKSDLAQRRQASEHKYERLQREYAETKANERKAQEQASREAHWNIDKQQREEVLNIQNRERTVAAEELSAWKKKIEQPTAPETEEHTDTLAATQSQDVPELEEDDDSVTASSSQKKSSAIWDDSEVDEHESATSSSSSSSHPSSSRPPVSTPAVPLPPVRRGGKIAISFTSDSTPIPSMPARESTMQQKLAYQAVQGLTTTPGNAGASGDDKEMPLVKKERGDKFFQAGDVQGAIAAYTAAIEGLNRSIVKNLPIDPMLLAKCHSNRSGCYLKLASSPSSSSSTVSSPSSSASSDSRLHARANLRKCVADCQTTQTVLSGMKFDDGSIDMVHGVAVEIKLLRRLITAYTWLGAYDLARQCLRELKDRVKIGAQHRERAMRERELAEMSHSGTSEQPAIPELPAVDEKQLEEEEALLQTLLGGYAAQQHIAFKSAGDAIFASEPLNSIPNYTQSLLISPCYLPSLLNRSAALLQCLRLNECMEDVQLGMSVWEEMWAIPKTGMFAVAPAKEDSNSSDGPSHLSPLTDSVTSVPSHAPRSALNQRIKLLMRRAVLHTLNANYITAQQDLQQCLALVPLASSGDNAAATRSTMTSIENEMKYIKHCQSIDKLQIQAVEYVKEGVFHKAIGEWTKAIKAHSDWNDSTPSQTLAAAAWNRPYELKDSLQSYRVHQLATLLSDRSLAYMHARFYDEAEQDAMTSLRVWQDNCRAHAPTKSGSPIPFPPFYLPTLLRLGSVRAFTGKFEAAIETFQNALTQWSLCQSTDEGEKAKVEHDLEKIKQFAELSANKPLL